VRDVRAQVRQESGGVALERRGQSDGVVGKLKNIAEKDNFMNGQQPLSLSGSFRALAK
jgi:hypothetical protein